MSEQVLIELTQVFRDVFADDSMLLYSELTAKQVPGWDSLTHIRLLLTAERKFGVRITAAEAGQLKTVGDLLSLLDAKVTQQNDSRG
jgi:acyl carrier protein